MASLRGKPLQVRTPSFRFGTTWTREVSRLIPLPSRIELPADLPRVLRLSLKKFCACSSEDDRRLATQRAAILNDARFRPKPARES